MSQKRIVNDIEILVVEGYCEGTGNCQVEFDGTLFSHVRFSDGTRITGLLTDGYLAGFLEARGKKFFIAEKAVGGNSILLGVVDDDNVFHDMDDENWSKGTKKNIALGVVMIAAGIVLSVVLVGIPLIIMSVISLFRLNKLSKILKAARMIRQEHAHPSRAAPSATSCAHPIAKAA